MTAALLAVGLVFSTVGGLLPVEVSDSALPPSRQLFEFVNLNGSGCPQGSASITTSPDGKSNRVVLKGLRATVGNASPADRRKNCQMAVKVGVPAGYTYALRRVTYRGHAVLAAGAKATIRTSQYFQGASQTGSSRTKFNGPLDSWYQVRHDTEPADLVFAPCGEERYLNINSESRVDGGTSNVATTSSYLAIYRVLDYQLTWKRC